MTACVKMDVGKIFSRGAKMDFFSCGGNTFLGESTVIKFHLTNSKLKETH